MKSPSSTQRDPELNGFAVFGQLDSCAVREISSILLKYPIYFQGQKIKKLNSCNTYISAFEKKVEKFEFWP